MSASETWELVRDWRSEHFGDDAEVAETPPESLLVTTSAIATGVATRRGLQSLWKRWKGEMPPHNPAANDVSWSDALIWAASIGAAVGVARVLSRRGVTSLVNRYRD